MSQLERRAILAFLGGAGTVTGSKFLVETPSASVLVDCGLFQGLKELRRRNREPFPVPPDSIDAVVVTHAHVDHTGYLPALVRNGFGGRIVSTANTAALSAIVLPDAGRLQEEEADYANAKGFSKHAPALPLFTEEDARAALGLFDWHDFDTPVEVAPGVTAVFRPAGHILGAASVTLTLDVADGRRVTFSGDLGRPEHPVLRAPAPLGDSDIVVVESTYGNREHEPETTAVERVVDAISRTAKRRGIVVIPAFAVDRTEVVLNHLDRLMEDGTLPEIPIYVDSPMALSALDVYRKAIAAGSAEVRPDVVANDPFGLGRVRTARSVEESKRINDRHGPFIVVSSSGMATGGRVVHHLSHYLPGSQNTVILVGYQAAGTRGRQLLSGARSVKMLGTYVPVHAEIVDAAGFSVHADRSELIDWLATAPRPPEVAYCVHGEPEASASLRDAVTERLGWNVAVPRSQERVRLV